MNKRYTILEHYRNGPVIAPGTDLRFATQDDIGQMCWFTNCNHIKSHSSPQSGDYIKQILKCVTDEDDFGQVYYFGDKSTFEFTYCFTKKRSNNEQTT